MVQIHPGLPFHSEQAASIKVMPSALNGQNGEHYPGGLSCIMLP
jgi:hypothetical protein